MAPGRCRSRRRSPSATRASPSGGSRSGDERARRFWLALAHRVPVLSSFQRTLVATFDATAMAIFAFVMTGGRFGDPNADLVLWGSAAAAALAAMVVATKGPASLAWVAIGYIIFAGLLAVEPPQLIVTSLAFALMPVVPRPRESLAIGLTIASATALLVRTFLPLLA